MTNGSVKSCQESIRKRDLDYFQITRKFNCRFDFLGPLTIMTASTLDDRLVQFDSQQQQKRSFSSVLVPSLT